jgi:RHS repeat-associated protein
MRRRNKRNVHVLKTIGRTMLMLFLALSVTLSSLPIAAMAGGVEPIPQYLDPNDILGKLPGGAMGASPQYPSPFRDLAPPIPQGMQGGFPQPPVSDPAALGAPDPTTSGAGGLNQGAYTHPVDVTTGKIKLQQTDIRLPGNGFGFTLERTYDADREEPGAFGIGWDFNWNSLLRMYADFAMGEFRADGTVNSYSFVKDDPNGYILRYDEDHLVNYELHKGHYEVVQGHKLERISRNEYAVTQSTGEKVTYYGYYAPWRTSQDPKAGKMTYMQDRYGNAMQFEYDSAGRISEIRDTAGRTVTLHWQNGVIVEAVLPDGNPFSYTYDSEQRLVKVTTPEGREESYAYDGQNRLIRKENGEGGASIFTYEANDRVAEVKDELGAELFSFRYASGQTFMHNAAGQMWTYGVVDEKMVSVTDPDGITTAFTYNDDDLITQTEGPSGTEITEYNRDRNPVRKVDVGGGETLYEYHSVWKLPVKIKNPDGTETLFNYDDKGNISQKTNPAGENAYFAYDSKGRLVGMTNEANDKVDLAYDAAGNIVKKTDALGSETIYEYDGLGRLTKEVRPGGSAVSMSYDTDGKLLVVASGESASRYKYDRNGLVVEVSDALGGITAYERDNKGLVKKVTDPLQRSTRYDYDVTGQLAAVINPLGQTTIMERDALGRMTALTDERGIRRAYTYGPFGVKAITGPRGIMTYHYTAAGQLQEVVAEDGRKTILDYDDFGRLDKVIDPLGRERRYTYDELGRTLTETRPDGTVVSNEYDALGRLSAQHLPNESSIRYEYDALRRPVRTMYPDGSATGVTYGLNGKPATVTDALGQTLSYEYDEQNRLAAVLDAAGGRTAFAYNAAGWLLSVTDALGNETAYSYDAVGRVTAVTDAEGGITHYRYDVLDRLVTMTDAENRIHQWEYDAEENKSVYINPAGQAFSYYYTDDLLPARIVDPLGQETVYEYNALGLPVKLTDALGGETRLDYDDAGRLIRRTLPGGETVDYEYDELDRMIATVNALGQRTSLSYDVMGNMTAMENHRGERTTLLYDDMGRRTSMTDPLGNTTRWEYNGLGHVTKVIDARGHETSVSYNALGKTERVTAPDGAETAFLYDALGRLTGTIDPLGRESRLHYDRVGRMKEMIDALGHSRVYVYNKTGEVVESTEPTGGTTRYEYNHLGMPVKVTNALDETETYEYDPLGRLTRSVDPRGAVTEFAYDGLGRLLGTTDALGHETSYTYDASGHVTGMTDALGNAVHVEYDSLGRQVRTTDRRGHVTQLSYNDEFNTTRLLQPDGGVMFTERDALDRVVRITDPLKRTSRIQYNETGDPILYEDALGHKESWEYNESGRVIRAVDARGHAMLYTYDLAGNRVQETNALGESYAYMYDPLNRVKEIIAPNGGRIRNEFREDGQVVRQQDAEGGIWSMDYDVLGRMTARTNPLGEQVRYAYNETGLVVRETDETGADTLFDYDLLGRVVKQQDAGNGIWTYEYDALGRLVRNVDPLNATNSYTYDGEGNVLSETDPLGRVRQYTYDPMNRLVNAEDSLGYQTRWNYDRAGNVRKVTDALGRSVQFDYDRLNRLTRQTTPSGSETQFEYDEAGNRTAVIDPLLRRTEYLYDPLNRLKAVVDAAGHTTSYAYNEMSQLSKLTDANGNSRTWDYNLKGQPVKETNPLGLATEYLYNAANRLTSMIDSKQQVTNYSYTSRGELSRVAYPDDTLDYAYDPLGRLTSMASNASEEQFTYDAVGRMLSQHNPRTDKSLFYTYDGVGNLSSLRNSEDRTTSYEYDARNQMIGLMNPDGNRTTFAYNEIGLETDRVLANGVLEQKTYDEDNRLSKVESKGLQGIISSYAYTYDAAGNRTTETESDGTTISYGYDALNRLTDISYGMAEAVGGEVVSRLQLFNGKGNNNGGGSESGNSGNSVSGGNHGSSHGNSGNSNGNGGGNANGRANSGGSAIHACPPEGSSSEIAYEHDTEPVPDEQALTEEKEPSYLVPKYTHAKYTYDAAGNRLSSTMDGKTTSYVYDEANRLVQVGDTRFEYDENGNRKAQIHADGTTKYYYSAANQLTQVEFEDGSYVQYAYDAMGRKVAREQLTLGTADEEIDKEKNNPGHDKVNGSDKGKPDHAQVGKSQGKGQTDCGEASTHGNSQVTGNGNANANNKGSNENAFQSGNGNKYGLYKDGTVPGDGDFKGHPDVERTAYLYQGLSSLLHKEYSDKGSPYGEYYNGPNGEVISKKMFGLHGLVNPGLEPSLDTTGGEMYYAYNGRHTVSEITDRHGDIIESYRYEAFGGIFAGITAPYNTSSYTGHHYDDVAGLMDMKARWYDPLTAGFLTADTYPGTLTAPFTQNRYAYVGNNPINMWDPTGHVPEWVRNKQNHQEIEEYQDETIHYVFTDTWTFNSYSATYYAPTISTDRQERKVVERWEQAFTEQWNYTHSWVDLFYGLAQFTGSKSVSYSDTSINRWTVEISAGQIAVQNLSVTREHGDLPKNALPVVRFNSIKGEQTTSEVLISEAQFMSFSTVQQQIIADSISSFTERQMPKRDVLVSSISDLEDGAKLVKHYYKGVMTGLKNSAVGTWELIKHPIDTGKMIYDISELMAKYGFTGDIDYLLPIAIPLGEALIDELNRWKTGDKFDTAEHIGEYIGGTAAGIIGAKGINVVLNLFKKANKLIGVGGTISLDEISDLYKAAGTPELKKDIINKALPVLQTKFDELASKHLLPQYMEIDPNLTAGYTGSFKTGIVGNPNKPTYGQSVDLNKFDIDYWIESDILYKMYGNSLKADPKFRELLSETPGFEGLKPNKEGFSIKFKPSTN